MASRRLRIKAVANLPVRRGKGSEQYSNEISNVNTNRSFESVSTNGISALKDVEKDRTVNSTNAATVLNSINNFNCSNSEKITDVSSQSFVCSDANINGASKNRALKQENTQCAEPGLVLNTVSNFSSCSNSSISSDASVCSINLKNTSNKDLESNVKPSVASIVSNTVSHDSRCSENSTSSDASGFSINLKDASNKDLDNNVDPKQDKFVKSSEASIVSNTVSHDSRCSDNSTSSDASGFSINLKDASNKDLDNNVDPEQDKFVKSSEASIVSNTVSHDSRCSDNSTSSDASGYILNLKDGSNKDLENSVDPEQDKIVKSSEASVVSNTVSHNYKCRDNSTSIDASGYDLNPKDASNKDSKNNETPEQNIVKPSEASVAVSNTVSYDSRCSNNITSIDASVSNNRSNNETETGVYQNQVMDVESSKAIIVSSTIHNDSSCSNISTSSGTFGYLPLSENSYNNVVPTTDSPESSDDKPNNGTFRTEEVDSLSNKLKVQQSVRFGRKRVKPPVSLSIATRRPRDSKEVNENGEKQKIQLDSGGIVHRDGNAIGIQKLQVVSEVKTIPHTLTNISSESESNREGESNSVAYTTSRLREEAGISGITRLNPISTGDANDGVNLPLSLTEPDLPLEVTDNGSSVTSKFPQRTSQHVYFPSISKSAQGSASESEEDSKRAFSTASTITPPVAKKLDSARTRFRRPNIIDVARRSSLQGSGASASESEDDVRKPTSVASTVSYHCASVKDNDSDDGASTYPSKERVSSEKIITSKDLIKTNKKANNSKGQKNGRQYVSQRMLKAKKDFQSKFGSHVPDRGSLTMFDLIYYNPTTNPMKTAEEKVNVNEEECQVAGVRSEDAVEERLAEETVDEPGVEVEDEGEEAVAMPVPQVKVGPDGQIILDEKSLVIETTGSKKNREDLANSAVVVDYGTGSATYGTYSKKKNRRRKEWPESETLRFYRALQTLGTDFLLMQSIFPKLSRQDLKAKFKKEEKRNRNLVEKALRNPLLFDLTALEKELQEDLENEENNAAKALEDKKIKKTDGGQKKKKRSLKSFAYRSLNQDDDGDVCKPPKRVIKSKKDSNHPIAAKRRKNNDSSSSSEEDPYDDVQIGLQSFVEPEMEVESHIEEPASVNEVEYDSDSDSETDEMRYLAKSPQPTRSGRLTKPRILTDITQDERNACRSKPASVESSAVATSVTQPMEGIPNTFPNMEAGSIFVLSSESPNNPGHQIIQVFMVSPMQGTQNNKSDSESLQMLPEFVNVNTMHTEENSPLRDSEQGEVLLSL